MSTQQRIAIIAALCILTPLSLAADEQLKAQAAASETALPAEGMELPRMWYPRLVVSPKANYAAVAYSSDSKNHRSTNALLVDMATQETVGLDTLIPDKLHQDDLSNLSVRAVSDSGLAVLRLVYDKSRKRDSGYVVSSIADDTVVIDIGEKKPLDTDLLRRFPVIRHGRLCVLSESKLIVSSRRHSMSIDFERETGTPLSLPGECVGVLGNGNLLVFIRSGKNPAHDSPAEAAGDDYLAEATEEGKVIRKISWPSDKMRQSLPTVDGELRLAGWLETIKRSREDWVGGEMPFFWTVHVDDVEGEAPKAVWATRLPREDPPAHRVIAVRHDGKALLHTSLWDSPRDRGVASGGIELVGPEGVLRVLARNVWTVATHHNTIVTPARIWYIQKGEGDKPPTLHSIKVEDEAAESEKGKQ